MSLRVEQLTKSFTYPKKLSLFEHLSFSIPKGVSVSIQGASGEGKSTLLQILGTLEEPTEGNVWIEGELVQKANRSYLRNHHIGFVFQNFHLLDDYTVLENVTLPGRIQRRRRGLTERAEELLSTFGLTERLHHEAKLLSGGEKQRVALARALFNDPSLLFADEPTGNLDHKTAEGITKRLLELPKEGKTVVIVTHDEALAASCDLRLRLCQGKLIELHEQHAT